MNYKILEGDCIEQMKTLDQGSINTCVTSPPYYGLRDYGKDGQLGMEETPDAFVNKLVEVFREVKRVLRDDGTAWLNLGDSYAGNCSQASNNGRAGFGNPRERLVNRGGEGLKQKDLIGIPWRVALALQADGWYLRQDIIWHKPNPMPESVRDRCTKAHEYVFLLSKNKKYYFDYEAIKEPAVYAGKSRGGSTNRYEQNNAGMDNKQYDKRNKRSVWTVTLRPYKGAHFATFPPDLITPCVLAGCPEGGTVLDPFGGSGTTAQVSLQHRRNAVLCELNPDYIGLAHERIKKSVKPDQMSLKLT